MLQVLKRLLKHSGAYALATILNRATNVVLLPLYTRYLTKPEYGVLEILAVTSTVVMLVLQLGMGSALFRSVLYKSGTNRRVLTSTAHYFVIFCAIIAIILLIFLADQISLLLFGNVDSARLLRIVFAGDLFLVFNTIPMARLRIDEKSLKFTFIASSNFAIGIVLNILFVVGLRKGLEGVVIANAITAACFACLYTLVIHKDIGTFFSWAELKDMLGFGLPLVPASVCSMVLMMSDRYFLRFFCGLEEVASYGAAVRVGMVMALIVSAFQMAWPAVLFSMVKEPGARRTFSKLFNYFLLGILFVGLGLSVFARDVLTIVATERFIDGATVVPLIVLSFVFYGVYYFTAIGIHVEKKTYYFAMVIGVAAALNIAMSFLLVPRLGMLGASVAKVVAYFVLGVAICAISLRYYRIPFDYRRISIVAMLAIGLFWVSQLTPRSLAFVPVLERLAVIGLFPLLLMLLGFFEKNEIAAIRKMVGPENV